QASGHTAAVLHAAPPPSPEASRFFGCTGFAVNIHRTFGRIPCAAGAVGCIQMTVVFLDVAIVRGAVVLTVDKHGLMASQTGTASQVEPIPLYQGAAVCQSHAARTRCPKVCD